MLLVFLALAAIGLFVLAGLNIRARFFAPEWFGAACAAAVLLSPVLSRL